MELVSPPPFRLASGRLVVLDVLAGVLLAAITTAGAFSHGLAPLPALGLGAACVVAVAARRAAPLFALALAIAAFLVLACFDVPREPLIACGLAVYLVALVKPAKVAIAALVALEVAVAAGVVLDRAYGVQYPSWSLPEMAGWLFEWSTGMLATWAAGFAMGKQRSYTRGLQEQAERRAQARIDEARRTVAEERLRIARELHDVLAHSMSVIAVQAGVGRHLIGKQPEEAAKALAAIETTSRGTLREMRALLGVLREGADERPTASGLDDLDDLLDRTGLQIDLQVRGTARSLPVGVDLAAYRIVQESLTNVVKHAGTDRATVLLVYGERQLEVEITDEGTTSPSPGTGHGLIGMRERAELYGGSFSAGPMPLGGYRVATRLPTSVAEER